MQEVLSNQQSAISHEEAFSTQHSAFSQQETPNKPKELTEEEQLREAERISPEISDYKRERYVLARDGRLVHRIEIEAQVENRIRRELGLPSPIAPEEEILNWHRRQLGLLQKANQAPRCEHVFIDGTTCESPRMKKHKYCYAHERMLEVRPKKLKLLPAEDENSIMWNIMEIQRALIDDEISEKKAGLLLYGQQLQLIAVRGVTFRETDPGAMVRVMPKNIHHGDTEARRKEELAADERRGTQKNLTTDDSDGTDQNTQTKTQEPQRTQRNTEEHRQECRCHTSQNIPGDELDKSLFSGDERGRGRGHREIE